MRQLIQRSTPVEPSAPAATPSPLTRADFGMALALIVVCFAIYCASRVSQVMDSHYSMLISETLLTHGDVEIGRHMKFPLDATRWPGAWSTTHAPYQMLPVGDKIYYAYPIGSAVLSVPFVAVFNMLGVSALAADGQYSIVGETLIERVLAALLVALQIGVLFLLARHFLPPAGALVAALAAALASTYWSSMALAMWSHVWMTLFVALLVYHLAQNAVRGTALKPALIAGLCALILFVRPPGMVNVLAAGVYLLLREPRRIPATIAWGVLFLAMIGMINGILYGSLMQPLGYPPGLWDWSIAPSRAWWTLFAASRGLFVYMPLIALGVILVAVNWRHLTAKPLAKACLVALIGQTALLSGYVQWHGGFSFGPRLWADVLPWLFLLVVLGYQAALERSDRSALRHYALTGCTAIALAWSAFVHMRGANNVETLNWNPEVAIHDSEAPLLDWRYPQPLAGLISRPPPEPVPVPAPAPTP